VTAHNFFHGITGSAGLTGFGLSMPAPFWIAWRTFLSGGRASSADKIAQNARIFDYCLAGFYARRCKWWLGKMMHFVLLSGVPHFGCKTPEYCIWLA
jgi:hypothetical protein